MKEYMVITGTKMADGNTTEVTMIPLEVVRKKKNIMDFASGGIDELIDTMQGIKRMESKLYIKNDQMVGMNLRMGSNVTLEITEAK